VSKAEENTKILSLRDLLGLLPVINIVLAIIFFFLITNFFIDMVLFFMVVLTFAFFLSMAIDIWEQKHKDYTENSLLIYISMNVSPLVLYAGQFFYGYFFLSFIILGFIDALSVLSIFVWLYFGFSTLFLILLIRNSLIYVKEAEKKKDDLKIKIMKDLDEHRKTENYAAQSYYLQLLIKIIETPLVKANFLSVLITVITILLTIVPFLIPA
jgi:hypothetical protein